MMPTSSKMDTTWKDKFFVAAIDFGTTFSGFAISVLTDYEVDKANNIPSLWPSEDQKPTYKTPTCLLLKPDFSFHSFGYDAEQMYAELVEDDQHKNWHFFRRFKMKLYKPSDTEKDDCSLSLDSTIKDVEGRDFNALDVFSFSIGYMRTKLIKSIGEKFPGFKENEVHYVITTPAIWSERAKIFMRKAAQKASIPDERLRIALEPECAAVYVYTKHLPALDAMSRDKMAMRVGSCHLILDLGGGTLDITAHRVIGECKFEEIIAPYGGAWGSDNINIKFEQFLLKLIGGPALTEFTEKYMGDFLSLQRTFEHKKCTFSGKGCNGKVTIQIPKSFRSLHKKHNKERLSQSIIQTDYSEDVEFKGDKMKLKENFFKRFFTETIGGILNTAGEVITNIPNKIDTIICVGGFSGCELLKKAVREKFPNKIVIIPSEAETSIMKGAIIFGRDQSIVDKRIMPYTYGLDWNEDFDPNIHDPNKREETEDGYVCKDIFRKLIEKGAPVPYNKPTQEIDAYAKYKFQTVIDFPFYKSEKLISPRYIDEEGCRLIGKMSVNIRGNSSKGLDNCVKLKVYFGATELRAEAVDDTGKKYEVIFGL